MQSCGVELAESALVPEQIAALLLHVSYNLDAHAAWVGQANEAARLEHAALRESAVHYRAIAAAATRAAEHMRSLASLPAADHDPTRWDRAAFVTWMRVKIELQRGLAALLLEHALHSEAALAEESSAHSDV
jgi:hypothetical protein